MENPFTFGNPVRDPERFFGRKEEVRQVVNRLLSSAHESTSIVGERRIGKTSLLKYIAHPQVAPSLGLDPARYCLIYIDFQGLTDITPQRFWQRVLAKMKRALCSDSLYPEIDRLLGMESFDLFDLEDLCEAIAAENLTTVLLLDEFEYVTQNPNFGRGFLRRAARPGDPSQPAAGHRHPPRAGRPVPLGRAERLAVLQYFC